MVKTVLIYVLSFSLFPLLVSAAFKRDLYFGLNQDPEVTKLQEFLRDQGVYSGPVTGGFFSLTREAVKKFQEREKIAPAAGYFGRLTRARANQLLENSAPASKDNTISALTAQIAELQKQLQSLLDKQAAEPEKPVSPAPAVTTPSVPEAVTPAKPAKLIVSGSATSTFPEVEAITFKMGEFTLENNTSDDILVANFEAILSEEMDSARNRNREILILLRDGPDVLDTLKSTTKFTFVLAAPEAGKPHKAVIKLPFDKVVNSKEKKTVSVWIEKLLYVKSGTMRLDSTKTLTTSDASVEGNFNLVLTREPPL